MRSDMHLTYLCDDILPFMGRALSVYCTAATATDGGPLTTMDTLVDNDIRFQVVFLSLRRKI